MSSCASDGLNEGPKTATATATKMTRQILFNMAHLLAPFQLEWRGGPVIPRTTPALGWVRIRASPRPDKSVAGAQSSALRQAAFQPTEPTSRPCEEWQRALGTCLQENRLPGK